MAAADGEMGCDVDVVAGTASTVILKDRISDVGVVLGVAATLIPAPDGGGSNRADIVPKVTLVVGWVGLGSPPSVTRGTAAADCCVVALSEKLWPSPAGVEPPLRGPTGAISDLQLMYTNDRRNSPYGGWMCSGRTYENKLFRLAAGFPPPDFFEIVAAAGDGGLLLLLLLWGCC